MSYPYPEDSSEFGRTADARVLAFQRAYQAHGSNDPSTLFGAGPTTVAPWPTAARVKGQSQFDWDAINAVVAQPPVLTEMDPRKLHATQPSITRPGVDYYMNYPDYERFGRTYADQNKEANQYPIVYVDQQGRNNLLAGHHRAATALLRGRPLIGRRIAPHEALPDPNALRRP